MVLTLKYTTMATKKIDEKKTLKYAVAFYFCTSGKINFMLGNKMYQHINTVNTKQKIAKALIPVNLFLTTRPKSTRF
mgnify:CR=1 FL=1